MGERQISELAGNFVRFQHHLGEMPTTDRQWAIQNTEAAIALFVKAVSNRIAEESKKLLKFVRNVSFPAIDEFVVAEKFREGETVDGIMVASLGGNFKANFLKKVEKSVPMLVMREHELVTGSRDPAIITELGGEEQVESFLAHFWEFLKTANRELWHVCYIRDVNGVLWAVLARRFSGGLRVVALSLDSLFDWDAGSRFLSR